MAVRTVRNNKYDYILDYLGEMYEKDIGNRL